MTTTTRLAQETGRLRLRHSRWNVSVLFLCSLVKYFRSTAHEAAINRPL